MNYLDQANELTVTLPRLKQLQDQQTQLNNYSNRKAQLIAGLTKLNQCADIIEELQRRGFATTAANGSLKNLHAKIKRFSNEFSTSPEQLIEPESTQSFWRLFNSVPQQVENEVKKQWTRYVDSRLPSDQTEILDVLGRIDSFSTQADNVRKYKKEIKSLGNNFPQMQDFITLDSLASKLSSAWNNLEGEGIPPLVLTFLKNAYSHTGVSLTDLNQETIDWLASKSILGKFVIRGR